MPKDSMFSVAPNPSLVTYLLHVLLLILPASAHSEHADHDKPINLEADQVTVDDARQISTFAGNVRLTQGTLQILGEVIVVQQDGSGYIHAVAAGTPASFRQKREALEGYAEGYGERIEYDASTKTIDLFGQARLKRDNDEVSGEHITYNGNTEIFSVAGSTGSEDKEPKRVRAVLQPKPRKDTNAIEASDPAPPADDK